MALSIQQFSQKIKEKYPQYQNIDDAILTQKVLEKYPVYKNQVSLNTQQEQQKEKGLFEKSALGISSVGLGAIKGIGSTIIGASELGQKTIGRAVGALTGTQDQMQKSIQQTQKLQEAVKPQGTAEKIGFTGEQIGELFVPIGTITKGTSLLVRMAMGGAEFGGKAAVQSGGDKKEIIQGAVGGAIPVEKILNPVAKFFGGALKRTAGAIIGKGTDVIEEILKNPKVSLKGLQREGDKVLVDAANSARNKIIQLDRQAVSEYEKALEELPKRLGAKPQVMQVGGTTTIRTDGKKFVLSLKGVKSFITSKLRDVDVIVDRKKNYLDFTQSPLRKSEEAILKDVFDVINNWVDTSPVGLNKLAVKIGNYKKAGEQSELLNGIIGKIKTNVRDYIGSRVPLVKELNSKYAKSMDFIDALRTELSVPNNLKTRESIIKVAKKIQNLFTGNKELVRNLIKEMEGGGEIIAMEAGRQVAQSPSRASVSIGDIIRNLAQVVIPPKTVGEIAAYTGIASQKIEPIVKVLSQFAPAERMALFNLFKDFFSSQENQQ